MDRILQRNGYRLGEIGIRFCQRCYRFEYQVEELHIHHPEENGMITGEGGWQALYIHEQDFEDKIDQEVVCKECHVDIHGLSEKKVIS